MKINKKIENNKTIYDVLPENSKDYLSKEKLQNKLYSKLHGLSLSGLPLRTRSKVVKEKICESIGYPIPSSFRKTQPKFPCLNFDVYIQKSLNVQIWNEDVDIKRRYVLIEVTENDIINNIKVIDGEELAQYDRTGTLTQKYQATFKKIGQSKLLTQMDSSNIVKFLSNNENLTLNETKPTAKPIKNKIYPIKIIYSKLLKLVGKQIDYIDSLQERNRGAELHKLICECLGYKEYEDDGTYPDIFHQLLEIKLQTSPTIDLGLHSPNDNKTIYKIDDTEIISSDIRYVIFSGEVNEKYIKLTGLYVTNGMDFGNHFPLFEGKHTNKKIQLPLPQNFFNN